MEGSTLPALSAVEWESVRSVRLRRARIGEVVHIMITALIVATFPEFLQAPIGLLRRAFRYFVSLRSQR